MADYSGFLFDSLDTIGQRVTQNRRDKLAAEQWDKSYAYKLLADDEEQKWRAAEAARAQANADRSYALDLMQAEGPAKPPPGYRWKQDGGLEFIPGGPTDPAVKAAAAPPPKPRAMTRPTINDLSAAGQSVTDLGRINEEWNPEYGGYKSAWWGDFNNWLGRIGVGVGVGGAQLGASEDAALFWQDYQTYKNKVRHDLFGSALTATERAEFDKAVINPGMSPDVIKKNLERQQELARQAAAKIANTYIMQGIPPAQIEAALGVPLAEIGIAPPAAAPGPGAAMDPESAVSAALDAIAQGADPDAVRARLEQMGIDPAILDQGGQ